MKLETELGFGLLKKMNLRDLNKKEKGLVMGAYLAVAFDPVCFLTELTSKYMEKYPEIYKSIKSIFN